MWMEVKQLGGDKKVENIGLMLQMWIWIQLLLKTKKKKITCKGAVFFCFSNQ